MAATIGRLRAVLSANTTEFNQGFQRAKQSLNRFNGNMRFTRKQLKRFVEASSNTAQPLSASLKQANTVLNSNPPRMRNRQHFFCFAPKGCSERIQRLFFIFL